MSAWSLQGKHIKSGLLSLLLFSSAAFAQDNEKRIYLDNGVGAVIEQPQETEIPDFCPEESLADDDAPSSEKPSEPGESIGVSKPDAYLFMRKSAFLAVGFSLIIPGSGQFYIDSFGEGFWTKSTPYRGALYFVSIIALSSTNPDDLTYIGPIVGVSVADALISTYLYNINLKKKLGLALKYNPENEKTLALLRYRF